MNEITPSTPQTSPRAKESDSSLNENQKQWVHSIIHYTDSGCTEDIAALKKFIVEIPTDQIGKLAPLIQQISQIPQFYKREELNRISAIAKKLLPPGEYQEPESPKRPTSPDFPR